MKFTPYLITVALFILSCQPTQALKKYGKQYQNQQDYTSLQQVMDVLPSNADTALVKKYLGEPIDMGFDYRYLLDSTGPNGCVVGAVFHIDAFGNIDDKWIGEICE